MEDINNSNVIGENETKKRRLPKPAVITAVCAVILLILAFCLKDTILSGSALKKAGQGDFAGAKSISSYIGKTKGDSLRKYIDLRLEINRAYPGLLVEFNKEKISSWRDTALEIKAESEKNYAGLFVEVSGLYDTLDAICSFESRYSDMRDNILEMMNVFDEINRLYSKDASGNSVPFTIGQETARVEKWEGLCSSLINLSDEMPGGEKVYLLSFLTVETRAECKEIKDQMNDLRAKGYGDDDPVRVSSSGHKSFPDIANSSGVSVSVSRKEEYEKYMYSSICRALTESLAQYYTGIDL